VTPVLAALAPQFQADNPGYILEVLPGSDTGDGVRGTIAGVLDAAAMSRAARDTEIAEGITYVQFGTSVTTVYANPASQVTELTSTQLRDIFMGRVENWSEVDGADLNVVLYIRDPEEGNTVDLRETFIGEPAYAPFSAFAVLMNSQTDMQNAVAAVEGAVGYGTWAAAVANEAEVINIAIDGIGIENAPESMVNVMGIGYLTAREADLQPLISWLRSDAGKTALEALTIVPFEAED
jgi:phosphate transport system substrate-binding protein